MGELKWGRVHTVHRLLHVPLNLLSSLLCIHPCSIRVSSVAKRILHSHLASIFAVSIAILSSIFQWLNDFSLIVIGFDFRICCPELPRGGSLATGTGSHRGA